MSGGMAESPARTVRVLHLEDDPWDVDLVREALLADGLAYEVTSVATREEFARALERGGVDVVLSDFAIPAFDGLSALALVRGRAPYLPFILVSGTLGEEAAIESVRAGATDYVLKHRLSRLGPAVRRALAEAGERRRRAEAEDALEKERQFLRAVLESVGAGIVACDAEGTVTLFNRATREFYGLPEEPLPSERWAEHYDLYLPDGRTPMRKEDVPLFRALQGERVDDAEMMIVPKQGAPRTLLASGQPIVDGAGRKLGAVVAMHDITERKQLEQQLFQAQKMEAVGRLAGGVAHDFNNLLGVILGYAEMLLAGLGPEDPLRAKLRAIKDAAGMAASLTRQLLAFSRKQIVEPRVLHLNVLLGEMNKMLRRLIGEDIALETSLAPGLGRIKADPGQVEQIVMNLAVNARDAMPQGGRLTIETADVDLGEGHAQTHAVAAPGPYVQLAVSDTGVGMTPDVRARIFEPFFTTKEEGKGTGLGLATVYGIVKQSGGHIQVTSEPGRGTTFRIRFPRVEQPAENARSPEPDTSPLGTETVLVVEDEDTVRDLLEESLREYGYRVITAANAAEAEEAGRRHEGPIHLLMTDLVLPGASGRVAAERLSQLRPELKVLYMSGYTDDAILRHGVIERGMAFLQKPFALTALARKVREVLDS